MSVTRKKRHVSKKNKKAWRKYCDIKDVEDFLEDQRLEERLGKFETKADSELFVVDTGADEKPEVDDVKPLSLKQRKRTLLSNTPKCFEVLLSASKVPDPNTKRNHVNPVGLKETALSKLSQKRSINKGVHVKKVELVRKNRKIALEKKRKLKEIQNTFDKNLWGESLLEAKGVPSTLADDFISTDAQLHNLLPDKRQRARPPPPKTVATRAAIETPHPGVSYNPSYQEHQDLLQEVVQHEQKMIKKEQHLNRVTTRMFSKVSAQDKEKQWREEMSAGLLQAKATGECPEEESEGDYKAINPPVKNKKKDHKARRKQRERIEERERLKREKIDKKKITDIYKLRKLESSISSREKRQSAAKDRREARRLLREASAPPALGRHKPPAAQPDLVEPARLTGDLRTLTTDTNLLRERFESLQRRGALAGSKLMMKKKRRLKSYFKAGHKVTDQDVTNFLSKARDRKLSNKTALLKAK